MSTHLLLEAAARSLVMGAIIFAALHLLRIEQVRARRTAWLLALAGALAMPALVAAQIGPRLLPEFALAVLQPPESPRPVASSFADAPQSAAVEGTTAAGMVPPLESGSAKAFRAADESGTVPDPAPALAPNLAEERMGERVSATQFGATVITLGNMALTLAVFGYCVVAAVLTLRLCVGLGFAVRLRNQAKRVTFPFDPELDVRTTQRLATPVTIGSSVLLPGSYSLWDGATLRVVLSHERAHVRQKDFYVQALAGLHCALFWFNPFSWWLQRQLAELGEALSDCAAVEQAESRTSYAETLLAFATRSRWPMTGVAMAAESNLTPRIERLLSDRGFERSFAPKQRLPFVAAGIVILAMVASTSMVRVQTASAATDTTVTDMTITVADTVPSAAAAPATPGVPAVSVQTTTSTQTTTESRPAKKPAKVRRVSNQEFDSKSEPADSDSWVEHDNAGNFEDDEGILAIHSGHSRFMFDSGEMLPRQSGDYIYFQHDGKPYLIQDPQIIAKAHEMLAPMKELSEKQKELGRQQRDLGAQQRVLSAQQRSIKIVESPEFKHEMAELEKTIKELDLPRLTAQIDQRALAEVQAHLGEIQARVGELQSQFGREEGKFGEEQGRLGEQQGKLGEQQGLLGEQQRKLVEDVRRQLKPIIEQAIREGKGRVLSNE
jgi:beta-lactamase regulating signal transducer with metallopeptidase domain